MHLPEFNDCYLVLLIIELKVNHGFVIINIRQILE